MAHGDTRRAILLARRQALPTTSEVLPAPSPAVTKLDATYIDPLAGFSAYQDLSDESKIGINSEQVSSGDTPVVLNLMLMGA